MTFLPLRDTIGLPNAIKIYWDTLDVPIRRSLVKQLFSNKELIDKRTKIHAYDDLLAKKLNFRQKSISEKPLDWRIDRVVLLSESQILIMHDICRRYLTIMHATMFSEIQIIANGDQPEPVQGKYPLEWYLRVVDYLATQALPPLACMFMFAMFADCEGRDQAFADERYEAIWQAHLTWYRDRSAIPESVRSIPEILIPVIPDPVINVPVAPPQDLVRTSPLRPVVAPAPAKPLPPRPVMPPTPPALVTVPASFGALQYLINRAIEDCCAHIKGALSHESMREALQELLRLNSNSVPYFYHIGYYQGLSTTKFTIEKQQTQIGQAWAFFGFVMGSHRDNGDAVAGVIERNAPLWQLLLKNIPPADLQVLYTLLPALIAYRAYDDIADIMAHSSVPYLTHAEHPDSVAMVIYQVAADLVRNGTQLPQADRILQLLITQLDDAGQRGNLYGRCLRKRGQYFRRKKQFHQASELFQQAIAMPEFSEIAQTHADIGMALANFPGLDALLPSDNHDFKVIIPAIRGQRDHFERGVQSGVGDDTNAQFVLGLLAFGDGDYLMALDSFRMAQIGMERQLSAYKVRDLYDWLLFLKIRTWSQQIQLSEISLFRDELEVVFRSQIFFPLKHWLNIFRDVNKVHPETGRVIMIHLFNYRDVDIYDLCSIAEVFEQPNEIWRRYFFGSTKYNSLSRAEKYDHLTNAWQIVLANQHGDAADFVLELFEMHSTSYSDYAPLVNQLFIEYSDDILRLWDETDVLYLRAQLLFMSGQSEEAISLLVQLLNIFLGRQEIPQAQAIYAWLEQLHYSAISQYTQIVQGPGARTRRATEPCRVLYVGGNETQQSFKDEIVVKLANTHPHIHVEWELIGWRSNWGDEAARIERRIPTVDLVILSPYVRTLFGRQIRKAATNWRASTGKGQGKIYSDIVSAVESFQLR